MLIQQRQSPTFHYETLSARKSLQHQPKLCFGQDEANLSANNVSLADVSEAQFAKLPELLKKLEQEEKACAKEDTERRNKITQAKVLAKNLYMDHLIDSYTFLPFTRSTIAAQHLSIPAKIVDVAYYGTHEIVEALLTGTFGLIGTALDNTVGAVFRWAGEKSDQKELSRARSGLAHIIGYKVLTAEEFQEQQALIRQKIEATTDPQAKELLELELSRTSDMQQQMLTMLSDAQGSAKEVVSLTRAQILRRAVENAPQMTSALDTIEQEVKAEAWQQLQSLLSQDLGLDAATLLGTNPASA
jgi:hypothetical protein